jgi:pimeloyl-ACP methyl ester carboxylesterase
MSGRASLAAVLVGVAIAAVSAQSPVSFHTQDGWAIHGDLYGTADRGIVLIHGGRFTKDSWRTQSDQLVKAGFRVLAIDLRGFGLSKQGPAALDPGFGSPLDALAAVRYLRKAGAKSVSIVGASMGADAAAGASIESAPGEIDRLVLLAGSAEDPGDKLKGRKLFIVARDDANAAGPRLPRIRAQYERSTQPKELVVLDGAAHAQFIFDTPQADRLMAEILRFLTAK